MKINRNIPPEELARMLARTKAALKDLAAGNGRYWKEAVGELHSQFNEIPIWVLLYEDGDLLETHAALRATLRPHMPGLAPLKVELFYEVFLPANVSGCVTLAARLSGDEIFSAGPERLLDLTWIASARQPLGFASRDSKRPG